MKQIHTSSLRENHQIIPSSIEANDVILVVSEFPKNLDLMPYFNDLSESEKNYARTFEVFEPKARFVFSRFFLRRQLARVCDLNPSQIVLAQTQFGKPFLPDSPWYFNLSHSEEKIILAISRGGPIGVDLEKLNQQQDLAVAEKIFSALELCELGRYKGDDNKKAFFKGWTQKEAFLKAFGVGLNFPLDKVSFHLNPNEDGKLLHLDTPDFKIEYEHSLKCFSIDEVYFGSLFSTAKILNCHFFKESF